MVTPSTEWKFDISVERELLPGIIHSDCKMARILKRAVFFVVLILIDHCIQTISFDESLYPSKTYNMYTKHRSLCDAFIFFFLCMQDEYAKGLRFSKPLNNIDYDRATFNISIELENVLWGNRAAF